MNLPPIRRRHGLRWKFFCLGMMPPFQLFDDGDSFPSKVDFSRRDNARKASHFIPGDQNIKLHEIVGPVADKFIVHGSESAGNAFQPIVKVNDDVGQAAPQSPGSSVHFRDIPYFCIRLGYCSFSSIKAAQIRRGWYDIQFDVRFLDRFQRWKGQADQEASYILTFLPWSWSNFR